MIIKITNNLSLKYFPYLASNVKFDDSVDKKFMLKCRTVVNDYEEIFVTDKKIKADLEFTQNRSKPRIKILFSANREDLVKYTQKYDEVFDIYPIVSMGFEAIDFKWRFSDVDWLVFTSKRAVDFFLSKVERCLLCGMKIAAVGEKTANYLLKFGISTDFVPDIFDAVHLMENLKDKGNIVVVTAEKHSGIYSLFDNANLLCVYRSVIPKEAEFYKYNGKFDYGLFTSPSAFANTVKIYGALNIMQQIETFIAIGNTTKKYIQKCGFDAIMPEKFTIDNMFRLLVYNVRH